MSLKILHFTPDMSVGNGLSDTLHNILDALGQTEDVHLATLTSTPSERSGRYKCHCIGSGKSDYGRHGIVNLLALQKRFLVLLYGMMPDVIHIHGSYHFISSRIELWSRKRGFPVVFSPCGGMNPAFIDAEYGMRTWKMILYQKNMTRRASAMQLSDRAEMEYLSDEELSRRLFYIEAPGEDAISSDYEEYASQLVLLYEKVLDTALCRHLDVNSQEALSALLHLGLSDEPERHPLCAEDILNLRSLNPSQWHAIQLYGRVHDIMPLIETGASRMQLRGNLTDEAESDPFPPLYPKSHDPLKSDKLLSGNKRRKRMIENVTLGGEYSIRKTCVMLENIKHHLSKRSLTLHHLCDLYEVFRYEPMNEHRLHEVLHHLRLLKLCRRLCQVLSEAAYLDTGFMPVDALDDHGAEKIRKALVAY